MRTGRPPRQIQDVLDAPWQKQDIPRQKQDVPDVTLSKKLLSSRSVMLLSTMAYCVAFKKLKGSRILQIKRFIPADHKVISGYLCIVYVYSMTQVYV